MNNRLHRRRIFSELREAGITSWGMMKLETAKLPQVIHEDEHIGGVVYGRTVGDKIGSAMLVATDKRVIFIDVKPFFTTSDEIAYRVVSGIKVNNVWPFAGLTLHTRIRDYGLKFVNKNCAKIFETFIENYIELHTKDGSDIYDDVNDVTSETVKKQSAPGPSESATPKLDEFLSLIDNHNTAVLSTVDNDKNAHGAVIHYMFENGIFYMVTKAQTYKAKNMRNHPQVSLTIHAPNGLKTTQISGLAEQEYDTEIKDKVYNTISAPKQYAEGAHLPPIMSLKKGEVVIFRITPIDIQYQDFSKNNW